MQSLFLLNIRKNVYVDKCEAAAHRKFFAVS